MHSCVCMLEMYILIVEYCTFLSIRLTDIRKLYCSFTSPWSLLRRHSRARRCARAWESSLEAGSSFLNVADLRQQLLRAALDDAVGDLPCGL